MPKLALDPVVSEPQRKAMFAALSGHSTIGIPKAVAEKFVGKHAHDMQPADWRAMLRGLLKYFEEESDEPEHADAKSKSGADGLDPNGAIPTFAHIADDAEIASAGIVYRTPQGAALWLRRSEKGDHAGQWAFPGGRLDPGENPETAARREADEEIGFAPEGALEKLHRDGTYQTFVQEVDGPFHVALNDEHTAYAWAPLDQPPGEAHPGVRRMLDKLATDSEAGEKLDEQIAGASDESPWQGGSVRTIDADGRLHVEKTPISKAVVNEYLGREIPGKLGLDPDKRYKLLRDPTELKKAAATFNNLPVLKRHVPVNADNHMPDDVIGSTGTDAAFEHPYLFNSLVIWSKADIDDIEQDLKKEISCAYRYTADMTPGEYDGQPYDGVMRDLVGNHVAIVKEGRAGHDVVVGDSMESLMPQQKIVLTRKGAAVAGALSVYIKPLLAQDAKFDITPFLADITAENYGRQKPVIAAGIIGGTHGKLKKEASLAGLDDVLLALDAVDPEEKEDKAEDAEEDDEEEKKAKEKEGEDKRAKDKKARDKKARDKKARDDYKDLIKSKMNAEDAKEACDAYDALHPAEDAEEDDEEKEEKKEAKDRRARDKAKDGAKDNQPDLVTKGAMDEALAAERQKGQAIREAERYVRPWVGDLTMAFDSADDVYKAALKMKGVKVDGVHPSAFKLLLEKEPKAGAKPAHIAQVAMDAAGTKSFNDMFPGAEAIRLG